MNFVENPLIAPQRRVMSQRRVCMALERDFRKCGAALLHQQCGLWGFDVRREVNGMRQNALLQLGFERTPPPANVLGATTYARCESSGARITLWGFGMHFGDQNGGIFLSRFAFWPRYSSEFVDEHFWMPAQLLEIHRAPRRADECLQALDYFCGALSWIASYEREIEARFGAGYRAGALQSWTKSKAELPAPNIARDWEQLATICESQTRFSCRCDGQNRQLSRAELEMAMKF